MTFVFALHAQYCAIVIELVKRVPPRIWRCSCRGHARSGPWLPSSVFPVPSAPDMRAHSRTQTPPACAPRMHQAPSTKLASVEGPDREAPTLEQLQHAEGAWAWSGRDRQHSPLPAFCPGAYARRFYPSGPLSTWARNAGTVTARPAHDSAPQGRHVACGYCSRPGLRG